MGKLKGGIKGPHKQAHFLEMVPRIVLSHVNIGIPYTPLVETEKRHPRAFPNMPKLNSHIMYPATSSIHKMKTIFPGKVTAKKNECLGEGSEMRRPM